MEHLYLPGSKDNVATSGLSGVEEEAREKHALVKAYEKALQKPWFMAKKIKERDVPIYNRWCSVLEEKNIDTFLINYICRMREDDPAINPFDMMDEISIVYPTVHTSDMFQLVNDRKSFKSTDMQWSGHSELYSRVWAEMDVKPYLTTIAMDSFVKNFDDHVGLFKMLDDIDQKYQLMTDILKDAADRGVDPVAQKEANKKFKSDVDALKLAVFNGWFKRIEASVSSLGSFRSIRKTLITMVEYSQVLGIIPYELISQSKRKPGALRWLEPKRKIPSPNNIIIVKNRRDNSYTAWNFKSNKEVYLAFDKYGVPFDTKLMQILKAEYTYAELFKKQNGTHLSDGFVLVEEKDQKDGQGSSDGLGEEEREEAKARDREEEELWKSQLRGFDDNVQYYESGPGGKPARVTLQGIARPGRMTYMGVNGKGRRGAEKEPRDPTQELIGSLKKQLTSGEKDLEETSRLLRTITKEEDNNMKNATKKLKDLLSTKHEYIHKINRNLDNVSKEMDHIMEHEADQCTSHDAFGIIPIKKIVSSMSASSASVDDLIMHLERSLKAVGVDPSADSEQEIFKVMDTRLHAAASSAIHRAQLELRTVLMSIEKILEHMENVMTNHTSSLNPPTTVHERVGLNEVALSWECFDENFAGILRGPADVTPAEAVAGGSGDTRADELYAEYYSKLKEANDIYKKLNGEYKDLARLYQKFQSETLESISPNAAEKAKTQDARKLMLVYKTCLNTQSKLNRVGITRMERLLSDLEERVSETSATNQKKQQETMARLESVQNNLQNILAMVDVESVDNLENAVMQSDEFLTQLREDRIADLNQISDIYRQNIEDLKGAFPQMAERIDKRREDLKRALDSDSEGSPSTQGDGDGGAGGNEAERRLNRSAYDQYGSAIDEYHELVDDVHKVREEELMRAKKEEVDRKFRADKARVEREAAIKERNHLQAMKRYGSIMRGKDEAKRRKLCNGAHEATAMTVQGLNPTPQMMVVKDHFRKAKIFPDIPERHMNDMRNFIKDRWRDYVDTLFPSVTAIDNHGVKTWTTNYVAILSSIIAPFLKLRYNLGLVNSMSSSSIANLTSLSNLKLVFFDMCNEFVSDRLLNAETDDYKHLMFVFTHDLTSSETTRSIVSGDGIHGAV